MKKRAFSLLTAIFMLFGVILYFPENIKSEAEGTEEFAYDDADVFAADALLAKAVMPDNSFFPPSTDMAFGYRVTEEEFIYQTLSKEVATNSVEYGSALFWQNMKNSLKGDIGEVFEWEQLTYEALIMDYLAYQWESESYQNNCSKTAFEFQKSLTSTVSREMGKNLEDLSVEEAKKYADTIDKVKKLKSANTVLNNLTSVVTTATDYYQKLSNALAIQEANDERVAFLNEMKAVSSDETFSRAVDNVIMYYDVSMENLPSMYFDNVGYMLEEIGKYAWKSFVSDFPALQGITAGVSIGMAGIDWLFSTNEVSESILQMQLIYNVGLYTNMAYRNIRDTYISAQGDKSKATSFLHAYEEYIAFKNYANTLAENYYYQHLCNGEVNYILSLFDSSNKTTYDTWEQAIASEKHLSETWLSSIDLYRSFYDRMTGNIIEIGGSSEPIDANSLATEIDSSILWELAKSKKSYANMLNRWEGDIVLDSDQTISGDLYLTDYVTIDANGYEEYHTFRSLDLNGHILTITGNLIHKTGRITINNGMLNVQENYTIQDATTNSLGEIEYNSCGAELYMDNTNDKVNIAGNFTMHNVTSYGAYLWEGVFSVGGDLWTDFNFESGSNNKVILTGKKSQNIYVAGDDEYDRSNYINVLEVSDPSIVINFTGELDIYQLGSDINIQTDDLNIKNLDLNGHTITINGDVKMDNADRVDLNGGILTINGNLTQKEGSILCNNGTLNVNGNYAMEDAVTNNLGEIEYNSCEAELHMVNKNDKINISGNFITHNLYAGAYGVYLGKGVFSVSGDIWTDSGFNLYNYGGGDEGKVVLTGTKSQEVYMADAYIYILEVANPSDIILYTGEMNIGKLNSDINIQTDNLNIENLDLNGHTMTINGDVKMDTDSYLVDLNGGILTINGNLMQKAGVISCNNGTLNVNGDYIIEDAITNNVGETEYNDCYARFDMENKHDKVNISGNLTAHRLKSGIYLQKGTLTIGGDILIDDTDYTYIWTDSNGEHTTILSGKGKQSVTVGEYDKFDVLMLTKPLSNYTFNPNECWNTLVMSIKGDVNADNEFSVADVVMLQRWLLADGTKLKSWQSADLCEDGIIDVFDLVMMKRMLIEK